MTNGCPCCGSAPYGGTCLEFETPSGQIVEGVVCPNCSNIYQSDSDQ